MHPRHPARCLLLLVATVLLSSSLARAQVHELPTRFYLLPRTQHRYDSADRRRVTRRCWLLRYTERRYRDAGNGSWYLERKDRASWFFGRVTRQVEYNKDHTRYRVYRYRRNFSDKQIRPTWTAGEEYLVAERKYGRDGKLKEVSRNRAWDYKLKQRDSDGKMGKFYRRNYRYSMPKG
jgi:hypothetical protein